MARHRYQLRMRWGGGWRGEGRVVCGNLNVAVSVPEEFGGAGVGTNPEEMLLGAAANCYLINLAKMLEDRELPVADLSLSTEGVFIARWDPQLRKTALSCENIIHRPRITLLAGATGEQEEAATEAAHRADKACMVTRALRGNVEVAVEQVVAAE